MQRNRHKRKHAFRSGQGFCTHANVWKETHIERNAGDLVRIDTQSYVYTETDVDGLVVVFGWIYKKNEFELHLAEIDILDTVGWNNWI